MVSGICYGLTIVRLKILLPLVFVCFVLEYLVQKYIYSPAGFLLNWEINFLNLFKYIHRVYLVSTTLIP